MAYRSRSARRLARKSRRNFIITILLIGFLIYATIQWILPYLITGLGIITSVVKPSSKQSLKISQNPSLAPPVLNIPFEATNSSQIDIKGYGTLNSKVAIFLDDEKKDTARVGDDGSFEIKNIQLVFGTNNIYGKSIDEEGRESFPSKSIKVILDNEKPILEMSEPEDGKTIQGERKIKIAGKTEVNALIFINESQAVVDKEGKFESIQSLNDGENIFTIKAQDTAGNFTEVSARVVFQP